MDMKKRVNKLRRSLITQCKKVPALHFAVRIDTSLRLNEYQKRIAANPIDEKAVFFESFSGGSYGCSPKAIYKEMCADDRFDDWTFYWSFRINGQPFLDEALELGRAVVVRPGSDEYYDALASCKYWVRNNRVAEFAYPRDEQVYVQTWHGTPLKALGLDAKEVKGGSYNSGMELARQNIVDMHKWTYLISPSPYTSKCLSSAFAISEDRAKSIIVEEGYPRNDDIVNRSASAEMQNVVKRHLGLPLDKKMLLYAPTWRDDQRDADGNYYFDLSLDLNAMKKALGKEWAILVRLHSLVKNRFDLSRWSGFAYDASDVNDINDLYCISDALCTDYSSVFFDFANTGRPIYFFVPDYEHYKSELHDFYIDMDETPGPKCQTTDELIAKLKGYDGWMDMYGNAYANFKSRFCPWDDGNVSKRVVARCIGADS